MSLGIQGGGFMVFKNLIW